MTDVAQQVIAKVGLWWPDADEGQFKQAAAAWDRLATEIDRVCATGLAAAQHLKATNSGVAVDAFAELWDKYGGDGQGYLSTTANASRQMAAALRQYAEVVHQAKRKIEELAVTIGATLIAGTALAFFTFGISDAAAAATTAALVEAGLVVEGTVAAAVAGIVTTVLVGAAMGALEGFVLDIAVAQPIRVWGFHDGGFSLDEAKDWAIVGGIGGGLLGGAGAGLRALRAGRMAAELERVAGDVAVIEPAAATVVEPAVSELETVASSAADIRAVARAADDYLGNAAFRATEADLAAFRGSYPRFEFYEGWVRSLNANSDSGLGDLLSIEEQVAIRGYTFGDSQAINTALREGEPAALAAQDAQIRAITSGLNKLPNYEGPVMRQIATSGEQPRSSACQV